jgi:hypothetical protein
LAELVTEDRLGRPGLQGSLGLPACRVCLVLLVLPELLENVANGVKQEALVLKVLSV